MFSKPISDCGCGGGSDCITKNKKEFKQWVKAEMKRLDCGCGCKGKIKFEKKYGKLIGGSILKDCPPGWRNDGLTCVENCKEDEFDDGLTCRKKCPPDMIDDGLTCRKPITSSMNACPEGSRDIAGTCWGPVRKDCIDDCFKHPAPGCKTWECGRLRGAFGEDWGPKWCTSCNLRCGQTCWDVQGITKQLHQRELKLSGGEVIIQIIRGKQIRGRINFDELIKTLETGMKDLFEGNIDLAKAFDPERNGINAAFRKFGNDIKGAMDEINNKIKEGFRKMGDDAKRAFEKLAQDAERDLKKFGQDFVNKMKDPDFWMEYVSIMAQVALYAAAIAVTATGVGAAFAPGLIAAASMVGPAMNMVKAGVNGEPIDALDIARLGLAAAGAFFPGMDTVVGAAITIAGVAVTAVKMGQSLGVIPPTCIANCPPPLPNPPPPEPPLDPKSPEDPPPAGELTYDQICDLAPPNTFKQKILVNGKKVPNPNYMYEADWVKKYRAENYGEKKKENISAEDKAIEEATNTGDVKPDQVTIGDVVDNEIDEFPPFDEVEFPPFDETEFPPFDEVEFPPFDAVEFPPFDETEFPPFDEVEFPPFDAVEFPPFEVVEPGAPAFDETEFPPFDAVEFPPFEIIELPPTENTDFVPVEPEPQPQPEVKFEPEIEQTVEVPQYYISDEQLESESFLPKSIRGGTNPESLPLIEPLVQGDVISNPWGDLKTIKATAQIPPTHTGAVFNPDCYATKNPEIAKELGNDKGKLTTHWIEIGSKEGFNADCGDSKSSAEERLVAMEKAEKEKEDEQGRKTNCKATNKFWVEAEKRCDGLRNADGTVNTAAAKCEQEGSFWDQRENGIKPFCNKFRDSKENNIKPASELCRVNNNYWDGVQCQRNKNVDGSEKTDADYCTGLNNYYENGVCDVTRDRDGKPRTEEQLCVENNNYMGVDENCWIAKNRDLVKTLPSFSTFAARTAAFKKLYTPENTKGCMKCMTHLLPNNTTKGKQAFCQTVLNGNLDLQFSECKNSAGEYPVSYETMKKYLETKQLGDYSIPPDQYNPLPESGKPRQTIPVHTIIGNGKPISLTLYWAEWCPHCHEIMPEWNKLKYKGVKIEAIEEQDSNFKVDGYPTIIFRNGNMMEKYIGERTAKAIKNFLKNKLS